MDFSEIIDRLICALYPPRCVLCGEIVEYDDMWCGKCPCTPSGSIDRNADCRFTDALAALEYTDEVKTLLWTVRDQALSRIGKRVTRFLAENMAKIAAEYWPEPVFDSLVPVPSGDAKLQERGYNQAELLANCLGGIMGIPVDGSLLIRREPPPAPHGRKSGADKTYESAPGTASNAAGKRLLLIDDVYITGATVDACADRLLQAGAKEVFVLTATKTDYVD